MREKIDKKDTKPKIATSGKKVAAKKISSDIYGRTGRKCINIINHRKNTCQNIAMPDSEYCAKCFELQGAIRAIDIKRPDSQTRNLLSSSGRYDAYLDANLADQLERLEKGDVFDLRPEVALLRLMLINYINLLNDVTDEDGRPKPLKKPDLNGISNLISSISVVLERVEKREAKTSLTLERFSEIWDVMATVVVEVLQDAIVDDFSRMGILERIKSRWGLIKL